MLTQETKRKIDSARDILVGKIPDPKAQVEQITTALIYKFMDDMDKQSEELGGKARFFTNEYEKYSWSKLMDPKLGGQERLNLYIEAITSMSQNPYIPQLFRDIFKDAYLPYRSPETLNLFLKEINGFVYEHSEDLGDAYEYLLSILGSQGDAGQFRTPRHIIDFIVKVVDPDKDEKICDPACGTAGFLISAYKHIIEKYKEKPLTPDERKNLTDNFVGYDISPDMVRISKVNMYLHSFPNPTIFEYDTLTSEEKWDENFDVMLANPPFMTPKGGIKPHKRFSIQANRAEVLFVDYILEHLNINGRAGIIVPEGIIFQSANAYKQLRKKLVEDGLLAVVSLPSGVFQPYSGVKTSILFFDNALAKKTKEILFIKISNDGYDLGAQRRPIDKNDLPKALAVIKAYKKFLLNGEDEFGLFGNNNQNEEEKNLEESDHHLFIPYNSKLTELARKNRQNPTKAEAKIWNEVLRRKQFENFKFVRQKPIENFIVDFYCSKLKLVIEIDGDSHAEKQDYDKERTAILEKYGLKVVRYTNEDVLNNIESVYQDLLQRIKTPPSLPLTGEQTPPDLPLTGEEMESHLTGEEMESPTDKGDLGEIKNPPDKGDLGGLFRLVTKEKIAQSGDYNLTGDRYKEVINFTNQKWPMVELGEVVEILDHRRKPITKSKRKPGQYPYYGATGILDYVNDYIFEERLVLIGEDGAKWGTGEKTAFVVDGKYWVNNHAHVVRPIKEKLIDTFLVYYLNSINLLPFITGVTVPKLNQEKLRSIKIPLPPLEVQKEIVEQIEVKEKAIEAAKAVIENLERERRYFGQTLRKLKDVEWVELGEVLEYEQPTKYIVKSVNYSDEYKTPVLTAGQTFILGYTNEKDGIFPIEKLPVIIFDDFTTATKFVDFAFKVKSSAMKILHTKREKADTKFLFYAMQDIQFNHDTHKRYWISEYSKLKIPLPQLEVQKQLVAEMEEQEKIIEANKKLIGIMKKKIEEIINEIC